MTDLLSSPDRAATDPVAAARGLAALLLSIHRDARREARSLPRPEEHAAAARAFWVTMRACADAEAGLDEHELAAVRARVREQLNPWLLRSRYWNRAYVKPHGYAGDFRMLEWIYDLEHADCADPTQPAVVNVLDRLFAGLHSARSVWQRRAWFARLVSDRVERSSRPVRVLDIACGGSRYLRDVFDDRLEVTFVDQDPGALAFVDQWLPAGAKARLLCAPVRTLPQPARARRGVRPRDLHRPVRLSPGHGRRRAGGADVRPAGAGRHRRDLQLRAVRPLEDGHRLDLRLAADLPRRR